MKSRLFPLENLSELITLRDIIYEQKNTGLAFEIIQSMQLRGKVPLSVELTLLTLMSLDNPSASNLSLAIVRFINNLLDSQQDKVHAIPLSSLCGELRIPSFWVDIRMQIAHQSMPSMILMTSVVEQMHIYLYNEFWALLKVDLNDKYLWSRDIIIRHVKNDPYSTLQYLKKLKCRDFYEYVELVLPNILISTEWIHDYIGYLLVEVALAAVIKIHTSVELSFSKALVYYCISNNVNIPIKYNEILMKYKREVIKIGLLAPYRNQSILEQLLTYGCEPAMIQQRQLLGNSIDVPKQNAPSFDCVGIGGYAGDISDQSWLGNDKLEYIDEIFKDNRKIEFKENSAFSSLKRQILSQFDLMEQ
eukprot:NODE_333_length_10741_cov_0.423135.p2 type:complete len:361 gc:universal NODE_333_length_10741_cov_0.423135:9573-8491(-)